MTKGQEKGAVIWTNEPYVSRSPYHTDPLPYIELIGPGPREHASNLLGSAQARVYEVCCRGRHCVGQRRLRQRSLCTLACASTRKARGNCETPVSSGWAAPREGEGEGSCLAEFSTMRTPSMRSSSA